jgi:hypothetical protein
MNWSSYGLCGFVACGPDHSTRRQSGVGHDPDKRALPAGYDGHFKSRPGKVDGSFSALHQRLAVGCFRSFMSSGSR